MRSISLSDYRALPSLEIDYLISRMLPKPGRVIITGPPKAGKSFLALQIALAVAQGQPSFLGRPVKKGKVLYLQFDTPDALWKERLDDLAVAGVDLTGDFHLIHPDDAMHQVDIRNIETRKKIERLLETVQPDLVVLDVLRKVHDAQENDSTEMKQVFDIINGLFAGVSLLMLHHTPKLNPQFGRPSPSNALRGSSFIGGEVEAIWLLFDGILTIESRIDEEFATRVQRNPKTGFWTFPEIEDMGDIPTELVKLCEEFPGQSHHQLSEIVRQRFGLSRASYYRQMKSLRCRHSEGPSVVSESHVDTPLQTSQVLRQVVLLPHQPELLQRPVEESLHVPTD